MFNLPETKRIRRSELTSPSPSPPDHPIDTDLIPIATSKLHTLLQYTTNDTSPSSPSTLPDAPNEDEFDFPLFTNPTTNTATTTRITLRTPTPPPTEEDLYLKSFFSAAAIQSRPLSYYFTWATPPKTDYSTIAIPGETILAQSQTLKFPAHSHPWRVIHVPFSSPSSSTTKTNEDAKNPQKKKSKPGKKRRIYLRESLRKKEALKIKLADKKRMESEKKKLEEQMAAEKRMLKNRERKRKKRAREKAKKQQQQGKADAGEGEEGDNMDIDSDSDDNSGQ